MKLRNDQILDFSCVSNLLKYCPETGNLTWLKDVARLAKAGQLAGIQRDDGYKRLKFLGKAVYAHRIAWLLFYGKPCDKEIDHINGDRGDNRIDNLRMCSKVENAQNRRRSILNKSGYDGVNFQKSNKKWRARISYNGNRICLGLFDSAELANTARTEAKRNLHKFNPIYNYDEDIEKKIRGWSKSSSK